MSKNVQRNEEITAGIRDTSANPLARGRKTSRGLGGGMGKNENDSAIHFAMLGRSPFTPKGDQFQISPAILHHTVWRTWLFIAYSDNRWLYYRQVSLTSLIHFSKGWECTYWTWGWKGSWYFQHGCGRVVWTHQIVYRFEAEKTGVAGFPDEKHSCNCHPREPNSQISFGVSLLFHCHIPISVVFLLYVFY